MAAVPNALHLMWMEQHLLTVERGSSHMGSWKAHGRFQVGSAAEEPLECAGEMAVGLGSCTQTQGQECNVFLLKKFLFLPASLIFKSLWFTLEFCNPNIVSLC